MGGKNYLMADLCSCKPLWEMTKEEQQEAGYFEKIATRITINLFDFKNTKFSALSFMIFMKIRLYMQIS
jgi:hypothetical protein